MMYIKIGCGDVDQERGGVRMREQEAEGGGGGERRQGGGKGSIASFKAAIYLLMFLLLFCFKLCLMLSPGFNVWH